MKHNLKLFAFMGLIIVISTMLRTADATMINSTEIGALRDIGRTSTINKAENEAENDNSQRTHSSSTQTDGIPGHSCYRTVEETFDTATQIVAEHPTLAQWIDVGDSWEKTNDASNGYDMNVLVLTNQENTTADKPVLFVTSAIHAREYPTAEMTTRFAEHLINNYGTNADVTWVLDHHEIHLMLQANPDGRKHAETGLLWRKNTNANHCPAGSMGVDLNRNFPFEWGEHNGSTENECGQRYRGLSPKSEPETSAIVDYMRSIYPDQRGEQPTDAAPNTTSGIYLDIHTAGEMILWPWGGVYEPAPNSAELQTLGRKLAFFNDYRPQQLTYFARTDGTTPDFGYGDLGVPSYTYELGTSSFQGCSTFEHTLLDDNFQSLLYAAKVARTPYLTPAGPEVTTPILSGVLAGTAVTITATVDDDRSNSRNGTEPSQNIVAAELYINTPPWEGGTPIPMSAADGNYDTALESVSATIDTAGFTIGNHLLYMRGQDADGNWGAISATFLQIVDPLVTPTATPTNTPPPPPPIPDENGVVRWCRDEFVSIPDNGSDSMTVTVFGNPQPIIDLDVSIAAEHTYIGDLEFTLTRDGTSSTLFRPTNCYGDNINVLLDDSASTSAQTQCGGRPALSGTHSPSTPLSLFNDLIFDGDWTLEYEDVSARDRGYITEWCLIATVENGQSITQTVTPTPTMTATATPLPVPAVTDTITTSTPIPTVTETVTATITTTATPSPVPAVTNTITTLTPTPTATEYADNVVNYINLKLGSSMDAVEERADGTMYLNSSDLEIGRDAGANQLIGLHYQHVNIPSNVTIIEAKLVFIVDEPQSDPASGTFFGEVSGNTQPFTNTANNISNRERTTTTVTWNDIPTWDDMDIGTHVESPSLHAIIQEIVDDSEWTAGNSLSIIVEGEGRRAVSSYNEGGEDAPILQIAYVTADQTNIQANAQTNVPLSIHLRSTTQATTFAQPHTHGLLLAILPLILVIITLPQAGFHRNYN